MLAALARGFFGEFAQSGATGTVGPTHAWSVSRRILESVVSLVPRCSRCRAHALLCCPRLVAFVQSTGPDRLRIALDQTCRPKSADLHSRPCLPRPPLGDPCTHQRSGGGGPLCCDCFWLCWPSHAYSSLPMEPTCPAASIRVILGFTLRNSASMRVVRHSTHHAHRLSDAERADHFG